MRFIKNSGGAIIVYLMVDATDGETAETGLSPTVQISKNGGAFATTTNGSVEIGNGWYRVTLSATETDTNGPFIIRATATGADEWRDIMHIGTMPVDVLLWNGTAVAVPTVAGVVEVDITHILGAAVSTATAQLGVNVVSGAANSLTASVLAADAVTELQAGLATGTHAANLQAAVDAILVDTGTSGVAIADGSLTPAKFSTGMDVYTAKIWMQDDNAGGVDRYMVAWFKNGAPHRTGITSPTLEVLRVADGTTLIAESAMTQIGGSGTYRLFEATNRISGGAGYMAFARATIGGSAREWVQPIGRDG